MLPLGKNIIRTLLHGVPESVVGKFVDTALVTAAREMGMMMRLRARSLSIAFMRKAPFCFNRPLPKISSLPLVFGAGARYSLIQTIHLPVDEVIQLRCPLMIRHHSCTSARARVTSLNRIPTSRMYDTYEPGHQAQPNFDSLRFFNYDSTSKLSCAAVPASLMPLQTALDTRLATSPIHSQPPQVNTTKMVQLSARCLER
ncbi:hypothetical protein N7466_001548 [Penicillium verhagenii]|uniref:uncharacterized protein n=1 Tax=Penicillium verhagenii TaxID=1562060 RepID=UPI00254555FD|nr:uncharacterized protein N7466_001548 [Penicillium verhagenii]KAJ5938414.1 hypothetical protein N7466_001548 [Penicillium verhagenii]